MPKKVNTGETLVFSGRLTIQAMREQKKKLMDAYGRGRALKLAIRDVEAVDLSFFQLLCSLHRTALRDKKRLELEPPVNPLMRQAMAGIGFDREMGCMEHGDETCIWKAMAMDKL